MKEVCGTCKYYDEWKNGYCKKEKCFKEPEDERCVKNENKSNINRK